MKKNIIVTISLLLLSSCLLFACVKETEYDNKEIATILYYSVDGWGVDCGYKIYDFDKMTYSEKTWGTEEYEVKANLTKEKVETFLKNIKTHGIFLLEKHYKTDKVIDDGGTSYLVITFKDETTFNSSFYFKYPSQIKKLDKDFLALSGYKLFEI